MGLRIGDPIIPGNYPGKTRMVSGGDSYLAVKESLDITVEWLEALLLALSANNNLPPIFFGLGNLGREEVIDGIRSIAAQDGIRYALDFIYEFWTFQRVKTYSQKRVRSQRKKRARGIWKNKVGTKNKIRIRIPHR